jgi:hypothetical protein
MGVTSLELGLKRAAQTWSEGQEPGRAGLVDEVLITEA